MDLTEDTTQPAHPQETALLEDAGNTLAGNLSRARVAVILVGVLLSLFLAALDMTIVATALPRIVADLGGISQISWVVTAYLVMSTTLVPVVGRASDIYGRKPLFIIGIIIFLVGSILSGLSQNMLQLILSRGVQGGGAAFLMANVFTVVGDIFPPAERGKWQGLMGAVFGIASIAGPLAGGYLTDNLSWRWIFYVNIPVGLAALVAVLLAMPSFSIRRARQRVDYLGAGALVLTLIPLMLALSLGNQTYSWASAQVVGLLVFSAFMFITFLLIEKRTPEPILPLSLFRNPIFAVASTATFLTGMAMFGAILFIPLFVQGVSGSSATNSGLVLTPMMLGAVVSSTISGQILSRWSHYRYLALAGMGLMTTGISLMVMLDRGTSNAEVARNMVIIGLGLGVSFPVFTIVVQNAFPYGLMGLVTASIQFFRSIGGALGVAIMGALLASRLSGNLLSNLSDEAREALGPQRLAEIQEPNALINPQALEGLKSHFADMGEEGAALLESVLIAMQDALADSLQNVFILAAILAGLAIIVVAFLKEIPLRKAHHPQAEPRLESRTKSPGPA